MPGSKRKIDEDTWIVSQSKKFKQGILLSSVYETTLAHLRLGAHQFFNSLLMRTDAQSGAVSGNDNEVAATSSNPSPPLRTVSPYNSPPGSPVVRDIISDNELQNVASPVPRPATICQDCVFRARSPFGREDYYGKCGYCEKLVCHLNACRGCSVEFCGECCIAKYDDSSSETYECYNCLH